MTHYQTFKEIFQIPLNYLQMNYSQLLARNKTMVEYLWFQIGLMTIDFEVNRRIFRIFVRGIVDYT